MNELDVDRVRNRHRVVKAYLVLAKSQSDQLGQAPLTFQGKLPSEPEDAAREPIRKRINPETDLR